MKDYKLVFSDFILIIITYPIHLKIASGLRVKIELLSPWETELFSSMASSRVCEEAKTTSHQIK